MWGTIMQGPVVMERDDPGVATHTVQMVCSVQKRGGYTNRDGGFSRFEDGGDPEELLRDCVNRGVPILNDAGFAIGVADAGSFACDRFLDTNTGP